MSTYAGEGPGLCHVTNVNVVRERVSPTDSRCIHADNVYNALFNAAQTMENKLADSLKTYQEHPDVQANLQQLQYDLAQWNLAVTTMTNINKSISDALLSIAANFR